MCKIEADTSGLTKYPTRRRNVPDSDFFELKFDVILSFGLTELKAQIAWEENVSLFSAFVTRWLIHGQ